MRGDHALRIFPAEIQLVQTSTRLIVPAMLILILWRFGKKRRRVLPTILEPAPPVRLICPRLLYLTPGIGPFLQITHIFAIVIILTQIFVALTNS